MAEQTVVGQLGRAASGRALGPLQQPLQVVGGSRGHTAPLRPQGLEGEQGSSFRRRHWEGSGQAGVTLLQSSAGKGRKSQLLFLSEAGVLLTMPY